MLRLHSVEARYVIGLAAPPSDPDALQTFALACHVNCRWQRLQAARLTFRLHTFKIDKPKFQIARQSIVVRGGPRILVSVPRILVSVSVEAERSERFRASTDRLHRLLRTRRAIYRCPRRSAEPSSSHPSA
jgi:hypothetical protein